MNQSPHRIRTQRWVLRTGSKAAAFQLRRQLRADWLGLLQPAFERAFDGVVTGEEALYIRRVELRLKVPLQGQSRLPELIYQQLVEQLRPLVSPRGDGRSDWKRIPIRQQRFEALVHYLRTGLAAWETLDSGAARLEFAAMMKGICREEAAALQHLLLNERVTAAFYFRLFQLVAPADAVALAGVLLENVSQPWSAPLRELVAALLLSGQKYFIQHTELTLAAVLLSKALARSDRQTAPDFVVLAERQILASHNRSAMEDFVVSLPPAASALMRVDRRTCTTSDVLRDDSSQIEAAESGLTLPTHTAAAQGQPSQDFSTEALQETGFSHAARDAEDNFALLVRHAGLVLLHPFLSRFFESTGVDLTNAAQRSPSVLARAASLLHFVATGEEEIYEYELGVIKVLLGLAPAAPVCVAAGLIKTTDRQESEGLLQAVISHWAALKGTSVAGFRHSFLNREALLREEDGAWKLTFERTAFDMLLDQLPWSISVIKLPWMARPLYTEW